MCVCMFTDIYTYIHICNQTLPAQLLLTHSVSMCVYMTYRKASQTVAVLECSHGRRFSWCARIRGRRRSKTSIHLRATPHTQLHFRGEEEKGTPCPPCSPGQGTRTHNDIRVHTNMYVHTNIQEVQVHTYIHPCYITHAKRSVCLQKHMFLWQCVAG